MSVHMDTNKVTEPTKTRNEIEKEIKDLKPDELTSKVKIYFSQKQKLRKIFRQLFLRRLYLSNTPF